MKRKSEELKGVSWYFCVKMLKKLLEDEEVLKLIQEKEVEDKKKQKEKSE